MIVIDERNIRAAVQKIRQRTGLPPALDFAENAIALSFMAKQLDPVITTHMKDWALDVKPAGDQLRVTYLKPYALMRYTGSGSPAVDQPNYALSADQQTRLSKEFENAVRLTPAATAATAGQRRHYRRGLPIDRCPVEGCGQSGKIYVRHNQGKKRVHVEHPSGTIHSINEYLPKIGKSVEDVERLVEARQSKVEHAPSNGKASGSGIGVIEDMGIDEKTVLDVRYANMRDR